MSFVLAVHRGFNVTACCFSRDHHTDVFTKGSASGVHACHLYATMANFIPPLDFSGSPNSFCNPPMSPVDSVQAAENEIKDGDSDVPPSAVPGSEGLCYGLGIATIGKPCIPDIPVRHGKLVKRQPSKKARLHASTAPKSSWRSYRVHISPLIPY